MNEKKILTIIEILFIVVAITIYFVKIAIPEYKEKTGSSDHLLNVSNYKTMLEFNVNNLTNFGIIIDKDKKVSHIFFFDEKSTCLYNKNIENNKLDLALEQIVINLIEENYLKQTSTIELTKYEDIYYNEIITSLNKALVKYEITPVIIERENTILKKANFLLEDEISDKNIALVQMDFYSKNFIGNQNSNPKKEEKETKLTEEQAKKYSSNIFLKIERYVSANNVINQEKENKNLPIELIPADELGTIYPTNESWYYINNSKIYAYIKFTTENNSYDFCYSGSIDEYKKGEC